MTLYSFVYVYGSVKILLVYFYVFSLYLQLIITKYFSWNAALGIWRPTSSSSKSCWRAVILDGLVNLLQLYENQASTW